MVDNAVAKQNVEQLKQHVKKLRRVANKVSIQCLVASLLPLSRARSSLEARHTALVKMVDEAQAEIDRLHEART